MKTLNILFVIVITFFQSFAIDHPQMNKIDRRTSAPENISIRSEVNPGMELLAIMLWLASNYPQPIDSKYKADVWQNFSKYRNHPEILKLKKLSFAPDFTENGLLLTSFPDVKIEIPDENAWFKYLGSKEIFVSVLEGAKKFAADIKFWKFHQSQSAKYAEWTGKFAQQLREKEVIESVDSFFRYSDARKSPQVT